MLSSSYLLDTSGIEEITTIVFFPFGSIGDSYTIANSLNVSNLSLNTSVVARKLYGVSEPQRFKQHAVRLSSSDLFDDDTLQ